MSYLNKNVAITGASGFLGVWLSRALVGAGAHVVALTGDIRDSKTFSEIDYSFDYLFHFAGPSSQVLFKRHPWVSSDTAYLGFTNAARACHKNGVKLIYPSTGLLSSDRQNEYARSKKVWEDIHLGEHLDALGLRIFATYGPGEGHKRDYASVPYLFARDILESHSPVVWGDGSQKRDLIYIDDVVKAVLILAERANEPIIDVGSGVSTSFNQLLRDLGHAFQEHNIVTPAPVFVDKPAGYPEETHADITVLTKYYTPQYDTADGTDALVREMVGNWRMAYSEWVGGQS